jgi:hypothetical protein
MFAGTVAGISALYAQSAMAPPMNALSVEPRVPRLGITPCVVELFQDVNTGYYGEPMFVPEFEYAPPAGCPGPWAKVIFSVELRGPGTTGVANVTFGLGDASRNEFLSTELLVAGAQYNSGQQSWRVERDITEYSALLREPRPGFARDSGGYQRDPYWGNNPVASGRMIFYPATPAQPAPEVPDAIFPARFDTMLPRNIERAYLDVYAQLPPQFWFSCVPADAAASWPLLVETSLALGDHVQQAGDGPGQGCSGSSYRDVVVRIDGQAAGVAPLYPWLNSDLNLSFERSVDVPVPTPQSINLMPYRVDLTPYAALLSNGAPHHIQVEHARPEGGELGGFYSAQLLVYLDRGSTQVTGAMTRNTLAGSTIAATQVRSDWSLAGDVLHGDVERHYRRQFEIAGYVNTSRGRINSSVKQEHVFTNTQVVQLDGVSSPEHHRYAQNLDLVSTTTRTSLRQLGTQVLGMDKERYHYPLQIDYEATGGFIASGGPPFGPYIERASAAVLQGHHQQGAYFRPAGSYANRVYANFAGSRTFDALSGQSSDWQGARSHYFFDSAGSCSRERVTWLRTVPTTHTQGQGCPDGHNRVRGFAHPDGSPDNLGWLR